MKSAEVMRQALQEMGVKAVASEMRLSTSLLYKWCEPHGQPGDGGAANPLDRVLQLYELTGDPRPIDWLCRQTNAYRVENIQASKEHPEPVLRSTQTILKEFSDVLEAVSDSYANENRIDADEAQRIRKEWEELKQVAEAFVCACEEGVYNTPGA